jgi:hypothetical protein
MNRLIKTVPNLEIKKIKKLVPNQKIGQCDYSNCMYVSLFFFLQIRISNSLMKCCKCCGNIFKVNEYAVDKNISCGIHVCVHVCICVCMYVCVCPSTTTLT